MRRILSSAISTFVLCSALAARAQTTAEPSSPDVAGSGAANAVAAVVVVADRTAEPEQKVGQSVTVLTLPQIQADQETTVSDILARTVGVSVTRAGGVGETTALNIRGAASDQTLVMIDGVRLDDPSDAEDRADFSDLLVGDISRIEVLRGPQSTLYGSQAIGGVVNIVTTDPTKPLQGDAQVEGGSYGTYYATAGAGGADGPITWQLSANDYATTGISAFDEHLGGHELDGYRNQGVSGRFSYAFTPDVSLDLRGVFVNARNAFDGFDTPTGAFGDDGEYGTTREAIGYAGLNFGLLDDRLKNRLAVQVSNTDHNDFDPGDALFGAPTRTFHGLGNNLRFEYEGDFAITDEWRAVFGAEHERSDIEASSPAFNDPSAGNYFPPGSPPIKAHATIDSGYAQLQGEVLKGLTLTGGVRLDSHSTFGDHATGQASAAWALNGGATVLRASWGQGFKAPSLYELYSQYGNASLRPEQANGWDVGVEQHLWSRRIDLTATYFSRDTDDLIQFVDCVTGSLPCQTFGGQYVNIDKARARGVELSAAIRPIDGLELTGNYTYVDSVGQAPGSPAQALPNQPRNLANAEVSYVWPVKLTSALAVRYAGSSYDNGMGFDARLKAYTLLDLRVSYPVTPHLEVYGRIENLTDAVYETTYEFGTLGRAAYVGLRARF